MTGDDPQDEPEFKDPEDDPDPNEEPDEAGSGPAWKPRRRTSEERLLGRRKRRRRGFREERWKPEDAIGPYGFKSGSR